MQKIQGWSEQGNTKVVTSGLSSVTLVQKSFPLSTITVYLAGTLTLASIYLDNVSTPLSNPFTASATGSFGFFAPNGSYDIVFSGTGIVTPFTLAAFRAFDETTLVTDVTASPYFADNTGTNDATTAINTALTAAATAGGAVFVPHGTYKITASLVVPAGVLFYGIGRLSKIVSAIPTGNGEMVRLDGDYAAIEKMWLNGPGQGSGAVVNGDRGIWIGHGSGHVSNSNYCRVENVIIDQTPGGNGICGDTIYSKIINNDIKSTTDACIHLQPSCNFNLISGNNIQSSNYSGVDCNGSDNRIVDNDIINNGGGVLDPYSQCGVLVAYVSGGSPDPNGLRNIIENNRISANNGWGVLVYNPSPKATGAIQYPYGTVIRGNVITSHTNQYNQSPNVTLTAWGAGIAVFGGEDTIIEGNMFDGNTFNIVVSGDGSGGTISSSRRTKIRGNTSMNAVTNAALTGLGLPSGVGYFFPMSARLDSTGGACATDAIMEGNTDWKPASDSYQWYKGAAANTSWVGWLIDNNHSDTAVNGFNVTAPGSFVQNVFGKGNYAINASVAAYTGFSTNNGYGLTANSATPSVINGSVFYTQNSVNTTYTNFTGGTPWNPIVVRVQDSKSIFQFSSGNIKGNAGLDYYAANGDAFLFVFDGTNWYGTLIQTASNFANASANNTVFGSGVPAVTQGGNKGTAVTLNTPVGRIVMNNASLNSGAQISFTLNNSTLGTNDPIFAWISGGTSNAGFYTVQANPNGAGSAIIYVSQASGGPLSEAVNIEFIVVRMPLG